ncbi:MAG: radical SAM protein [Bacteroidales bacterium]|jgi:MoaA/NifB/PqqE/SkfB family radical SAM enzyme|nr:radical SAM protein [Bacteroidales bacterium]
MRYSFLLKNFVNSIEKDASATFNLNLSKPLQVSIQPNERCNARCLMCDCWKETNDYINADEIITVLKWLKQWIGRNFFVQIAGGEPLIYKGIYDIFSFCAENGILCKISTNGIAFTPNVCDKIIRSGLPYLSVSLDSHLPEIHDKFRGVPGTLERAIGGIKYLAEHTRMTLGISSVIMKENVGTLPQSVDYFLSLPINRLLMQPIRVWTENLPMNRWNEYEHWVNDQQTMATFTQHLLEKKKTDKRILNTVQDIKEWQNYFLNPVALANKDLKKCRIGYDRLGIDYKGNVSLGCGKYGYVGNIKDDAVRNIWNSPKSRQTRRKMLQCTNLCTSNCFKDLTLPQKVSKALVFVKAGLFDSKE